MSLVSWAKSELERINKDKDGMQDRMNKDIMQIVEIFAEQGHSGFSANYALGVLKRLLAYKPLTPLTGEDDEWVEVDDGVEQNIRCFHVFRKNGDNATAHDIEGKIFSDDGGKTWFRSGKSSVPITFPYAVPDSPERVIVEATPE